MKGISDWEKDVKKKEVELLKKKEEKKATAVRGVQRPPSAPSGSLSVVPPLDGVRESGGVVKTRLTELPPPPAVTGRLASASDFSLPPGAAETLSSRGPSSDRKVFLGTGVDEANPASMLVQSALPSSLLPVTAPPPRRSASDLENESRLAGNAFFQSGDYASAVKMYTRSLGANPRSGVAFSNRSMAYLKLKEWVKAESDASSALSVDLSHAKSWQRRGAAKSALGKLRGSLSDLLTAERLLVSQGGDGLKALQVEIRKGKEALRDAVRRAPRRRVKVDVLDGVGARRPAGKPEDDDDDDEQEEEEEEEEEAKEDIVLEMGDSGFDVSSDAGVRAAPPKSSVAALPPAASRPAALPLASAPASIGSKAPTSAYDFERQWRSEKSLAGKASFLYKHVNPSKDSPQSLCKLFAGGFQDAELFEDIVKALELEPEGRVATLAEHVEDLARVKNVNLLCRMAEKGLVGRVVEKAYEGKKVPANVKKNLTL